MSDTPFTDATEVAQKMSKEAGCVISMHCLDGQYFIYDCWADPPELPITPEEAHALVRSGEFDAELYIPKRDEVSRTRGYKSVFHQPFLDSGALKVERPLGPPRSAQDTRSPGRTTS